MAERLQVLGWDERVAAEFAPYAARGLEPARVALEHQHIYRLYTKDGECLARVRGKIRHQAEARDAFPAVGDWVAIEPIETRSESVDARSESADRRSESTDTRSESTARETSPDGEAAIEAVLPRRSRFSRKSAGDLTEEQVIAANIDVVFLVSGLDRDFNLRRIERYLVTAWDGGAQPVVLLNKADLVENPAALVEEVQTIAGGSPVHAISTKSGLGLEVFDTYMRVGVTAAFLGSSGVGKSSLINALIGETRQRVAGVREKDQRGRHTTTHRELLILPRGGLIIDTPGMREMQLWEGTLDAFQDIQEIGTACHFRDCRHEQEPRCAVRTAVDEGRLAPGRLASFQKLQRELEHQAARQDQYTQIVQKRRNRASMRAARAFYTHIRDRQR
jgi:ribosome biogenesis GTPase / thiamine phosphate phosphatase